MNLSTEHTTTQLADLTAIITGKPPARSATKDAAAERFVKVATAVGLGSPRVYLTMKWPAVRDALAKDVEAIDAAGARGGKAPEPKAKAAATKSDLDIPGFLKRTGSPEEQATITAAFEARSAQLRAAAPAPKPASLGAAAVGTTTKRAARSSARGHKVLTGTAKIPEGTTKREYMLDMVCRKAGATEQELCEAIGWAACRTTLVRAAAADDVKLTTEKKPGEPTRYFGERKAAKAAAERAGGGVRRARA